MSRMLLHTLRDGLLAVTATNSDTVDDIALFSFVSKSACLVGTRWTRSTVDNVQLTIFPASENFNYKTAIITRSKAQNIPNTQEKSQDIRLFLFVELSNIFVCAHLAANKSYPSRLLSS